MDTMQRGFRWIVMGFGAGALLMAGAVVHGATVTSPEQLHEDVRIETQVGENGSVSGVIHNDSGNALEQVQIVVRHIWHWQNEFDPGTDNPGRAETVTLEKEVPAGESVHFFYEPSPPLPSRTDGRFVTETELIGFTELVPAKSAGRR